MQDILGVLTSRVISLEPATLYSLYTVDKV
jgi:hypothetical protein